MKKQESYMVGSTSREIVLVPARPRPSLAFEREQRRGATRRTRVSSQKPEQRTDGNVRRMFQNWG